MSEDFDAISKEVTGWSLSDWETYWKGQRRKAVEAGIIRTGRLLTESEMAGWCAHYGMDGDDFEVVLASVSDIRRGDPTYVPKIENGVTEDRAIRWRLRPERFREF